MLTKTDQDFLQSFEECSLGSTCWTHAAHVRIGWIILTSTEQFDDALERLRIGIKRFNASNNSIGYHETITVAFARIIDSKRKSEETWLEFSERNEALFEKGYLTKHYSTERLKSAEAKASYIEPDLEKLPELNMTVRPSKTPT